MYNSVVSYLIESYENHPEKEAVIYNDCRMSYKELYETASKIANCIMLNYNSRRRPIIVLMKNSASAFATFWGVAMSGNIYVPIDIDTPEQRLSTIINIVKPLCIIRCEGKVTLTDKCGVDLIDYSEIVSGYEANFTYTEVDIVDLDPLYILFTSGSTGVPKGVVVSHRAVIDFTEEASSAMDFSEKEIFLNQAPFYFDASVPDIYCTVRNGATLHIVDKSLFAFPIKIVDYIQQNLINALYWVPSALIMVANFKVLNKRDISSLKKVMFCGEVMPAKQLNMWRQVVPNAKYVNYYGPCEATYACSYYVIEKEFRDDEVIPIGKAAKNTNIMLIDETGEIREEGKKGEIYIRGTGLALGYYGDEEKTKASFFQNPLQSFFPETVYKTGDLGHYDSEGNIIYDGRTDYQIKHLGYRIELGEIENAVGAMSNIEQVACVYSEKKDVIACYYSGNIEEKEVKQRTKDKLPFYMIPQKIVKLNTLPMSVNGKVNRKELKQKLENE